MKLCYVQARPLLNKGLEDGNFRELVDPFLEGKYNPQEMTRMAACAAASIRHSAKKRSKMSQVYIYMRCMCEEEIMLTKA